MTSGLGIIWRTVKGINMSLIEKLFQRTNPSLIKASGETKTSGELISEVTNNTDLVDNKQTWQLADEKKDNIEAMQKCCEAEIRTMAVTDLIAAPYYFERVAILARKQKNHALEVRICEEYISSIDTYYKKMKGESVADVRKGPRYQAIVKRLPKAKELLAKEISI